jgi:hypothetical protein
MGTGTDIPISERSVELMAHETIVSFENQETIPGLRIESVDTIRKVSMRVRAYITGFSAHNVLYAANDLKGNEHTITGAVVHGKGMTKE